MKYKSKVRKFGSYSKNHLLSGEYDKDSVVNTSGGFCCADHKNANNRYKRRLADRRCPCRGICGCRNKVEHNG